MVSNMPFSSACKMWENKSVREHITKQTGVEKGEEKINFKANLSMYEYAKGSLCLSFINLQFIYRLHTLSRIILQFFKVTFISSASTTSVLPGWTCWTTKVLKVIMYFWTLTHPCWSYPLVKRCGIVLSDGHPSSLKQWKIPLSTVVWKKN